MVAIRPTLNTPRSTRSTDAKVNPKDERILVATVDSYLLALDARIGKLIPEFGNGGRIDLTLGLARPIERKRYTNTSPPVISRDVVVIGSGILDPMGPIAITPPGDARGVDVRTGKQLWVFHSVPERGEAGNETWLRDSWKSPRGVSAWAPLSADEELGYVYLPFSAPSNDYYGGDRPGDNLFGDSIVCLNAKTGQRVWHFQTAHHGLWDYDPPAAPALVDITVDGRQIKALAQVTKQGFCFVLDRATGKPVWPVPSVTRPTVMTLYEKDDPRFKGSSITTDTYSGDVSLLLGPEGLPLFKPPFGRITAINLRTGDHAWTVASGERPRDHPLLKDLKLAKLGWPLRTFVLLTKSLLITSQEGPQRPSTLQQPPYRSGQHGSGREASRLRQTHWRTACRG